MAAYRAYHEAISFWDTYKDIGSNQYLAHLEDAVRLDPRFVLAWAELTSALSHRGFSSADTSWRERAEAALEKIDTLAPQSVDHLFAQASYVYYVLKDYEKASELLDKVLAQQPSRSRAIELRSYVQRQQGRFEARLDTMREFYALDPRRARSLNTFLNALLLSHCYDEAFSTAKKSTIKTYRSGYTHALRELREDGDLAAFQLGLQRACESTGTENSGWIGYVVNRNYADALSATSDAVADDGKPGLSRQQRKEVFSYWLLGESAVPEERLTVWQRQVDEQLSQSDEEYRHNWMLMAALVAGVRGDDDTALELVSDFFSVGSVDWAWRAGNRHEACRILGMIGAAPEAVACLRDGFEEPSSAVPFLETRLPFYDAVRDELDAAGFMLDGTEPS